MIRDYKLTLSPGNVQFIATVLGSSTVISPSKNDTPIGKLFLNFVYVIFKQNASRRPVNSIHARLLVEDT